MTGAYWPRPWTCEDGGPLRRCCADGVTGLGIRPGERLEVTAVAEAFATDVLLRREPGELYALRLPEPSIARLSSDGESVVALGSTRAFRLVLDRGRGRLEIDESWRPVYGPAPGRSFGWDPTITDEHVFWMDNGRNDTDRSMLGAGTSPDPVRLWWARRDDASAVRSVEISGLPHGTESNPPAWDPVGGVVVAYDAGNAVLRAWRLVGDELAVLDLDSGKDKARVAVPSPSQGFLFPAPGFGRDVYYQSLTTIARIEVRGAGGA